MKDRSLEHLKEVIKIEPTFYRAYELIGDILKNNTESISWYLQAIKIISLELDTINNDINKSIQNKHFDKIKKKQIKLIDTKLILSDIYYKISVLYIDEQRPKKAMENLQNSIRSNQENAKSYFQLSKLTKGKESENNLQKAIDIDPEYSIK
tara:strand:+ start:960 stop:1415 length:456 start_codon:yes stop_codon:yes gene_type:complete